MSIDQALNGLTSAEVVELPRTGHNQRHFVLRSAESLLQILDWANKQEYSLCDLIATDDRLLLDRTFKLHYILSSGIKDEDEIVIMEYAVPDPENGTYGSIAGIFPNAIPLEREICDMFGLVAVGSEQPSRSDFLLHADAFPAEFFPLRRRRTLSSLENMLARFSPSGQADLPVNSLHEGMLLVPVGPIHAGIIEAGHFPFHVAGEVIESLPVRLGYKHRGIEKLFETHHTLSDGWELAEKVSGDSAVAHSVAYCQAVEDLTQSTLHASVYQWRALFLELERIYNHISDMGLLATGLAYERGASALATLREVFVHYVNQAVSGNRFLRGLSFPGGVQPPGVDTLREIGPNIDVVVEEALQWGRTLMELPSCRARILKTGILIQAEARYSTGLVARASGWISHDFRLRHPSSAYALVEMKKHLQETIAPEDTASSRLVPVYVHDLGGDVFARLALRVAETETSLYLVREMIERLAVVQSGDILEADSMEKQLIRTPEMAMGIGYAEGWRGDVMYVVFKGAGNTIARCSVRDPSSFNWHVFPTAVACKSVGPKKGYSKNILADFPLINKSFNLSYAGHDK